jgi:hypothetical protein
MGVQTMTTTFQTAKVGDRVYSPTFGWGEITSITPMSIHPIKVYFSWYNVPESFTIEGYYYADLPLQSLFWDEVHIKAPVKPVGAKVINNG